MSETKTKKFRYWICIMLGFGCLINYFDRINLTIAGPFLMRDFHITAVQFGILASAYAWTYAALQIPTGMILDKFGVKWVQRCCAVLWSVVTFATAFITGLLPLFILRLILGVGEAPAFMTASKATGYWFPLKERGVATFSFDITSKLSNVIGLPLISLVVGFWGWRMGFVVTAVFSVLYTIWFWVMYQNPKEHPLLSREELEYIQTGDTQREDVRIKKSSLGYLLKHRSVWGAAFAMGIQGYLFYLLLTWLPIYLYAKTGTNILRSGVYAVIPYAFAVVADFLVSGILVDHFIRKGKNPSRTRKIILLIGFLMGTFIFGAALTSSPYIALIWITIAVGGITTISTIGWSLPSIIAPTGSVGTVGGFLNFVCNVFGIAAPIVTGFIVTASGNYSIAFLVAGLLMVAGIFVVLFLLKNIEQIPDQYPAGETLPGGGTFPDGQAEL